MVRFLSNYRPKVCVGQRSEVVRCFLKGIRSLESGMCKKRGRTKDSENQSERNGNVYCVLQYVFMFWCFIVQKPH